jgi:YggT family protein
MQALLFILNALLTLVVVAFLLRLLLPLVRADFRNPLGEAVLKVTNPLVLPLRRMLPPGKRLDPASLVALLLVHFAGTALLQLVAGGGLRPGSLLVGGLIGLLQTVLQFYFFAVLLYALLSWFAGAAYNPAAQVLARLVEPLLRPIRRVVPPLGALDLSALFLLIALQALQIALRSL